MTTLDAGRPIGVVTANAIVRAVSCRPLPVGVVAHTGGDGGKGQGGNGGRARADAVLIPSSLWEAGRRLTPASALDRSTATHYPTAEPCVSFSSRRVQHKEISFGCLRNRRYRRVHFCLPELQLVRCVTLGSTFQFDEMSCLEKAPA